MTWKPWVDSLTKMKSGFVIENVPSGPLTSRETVYVPAFG